jgi:protein-disulfide isomerase
MNKGKVLPAILLTWILLVPAVSGWAEEDKIVKAAMEIVKIQLRVPPDVEIRFVEKRESAIPGFFLVKLNAIEPAREIPLVVYVDQTGEKVFLGSLFVKGVNVTRQEAGEPKSIKIDMGQFGIDKSPIRGGDGAKVTIVEFSNFECPYCRKSWVKIKELLDKNPKDLRYVFKHFPLQQKGRPFDLSAMAAAIQEVNNEAFWYIHDFLFSEEGQGVVRLEMEKVKEKIEQLLKDKGYDVLAFQKALENGAGKKKVEEDLAIGHKIRVGGTPTTIVNGNLLRGGITDETVQQYLKGE